MTKYEKNLFLNSKKTKKPKTSKSFLSPKKNQSFSIKMKKSVFKSPENALKTYKVSSSSPSCRLISLNHHNPRSLKRVNFTLESPNVSRQKLKIKNSLLKKHEILRDSRNISSKRGSSSSGKISLKNYINSSWLINKPLFPKSSEQLLIAQMSLNTSKPSKTQKKKPFQLQVFLKNTKKSESEKSEENEESEESSEICLPFLKAKLYFQSRESFC
jgi:hypothetical protein